METTAGEHKMRISLSEDVAFLNKGAIIKELAEIPDDTYLTLDMSKCVSIDYDVREAIGDFVISAEERNINVKLLQPLSETSGKEESYSKRIDNGFMLYRFKINLQRVYNSRFSSSIKNSLTSTVAFYFIRERK